MNRPVLVAMLLAAAAAASPARADAESDTWQANNRAAYASCTATTAHSSFANADPKLVRNYDLTINSWSGGCVDGKRDGLGRFDEEMVLDYPQNSGAFSHYRFTDIQEGTMVGGSQVGLWCAFNSMTRDETGKVMRQIAGTICYIRNGPQTSTPFTKDADGRWTTLDIYNRPTDAAKLPAGTLERESDRLIAAARSGQPAARIEIGTQVDELADLVRGGRIVQAYDTKPLGLSAKRVAVILSTRTIGEQARYQKMYAALVAGNGRKDDSTRKEALAAADPGALLTGIAAGVRKQAASVIPADDLSVLAEGKADYALVVDWGFDGRVDYSRRQYASLAVCGNDQYVAGKCPSLFQEKFTAYLIGSDLKAVRRITLPMSPLEHTQEREPAFDNTDEDYYTTYFIEMGVNFRNLWGPDGGMAASIAKSLAD